MDTKKELQKIVKECEKLGLSHNRLAEQAGYDRFYIANAMRRMRTNPDANSQAAPINKMWAIIHEAQAKHDAETLAKLQQKPKQDLKALAAVGRAALLAKWGPPIDNKLILDAYNDIRRLIKEHKLRNSQVGRAAGFGSGYISKMFSRVTEPDHPFREKQLRSLQHIRATIDELIKPKQPEPKTQVELPFTQPINPSNGEPALVGVFDDDEKRRIHENAHAVKRVVAEEKPANPMPFHVVGDVHPTAKQAIRALIDQRLDQMSVFELALTLGRMQQ